MVSPHRSGFTIMRNVWLFACGGCVESKGNARFTSRGALTPPKVPDGAVIQLATHFFPPLWPSSFATALAARQTESRSILMNVTFLGFDMVAILRGKDAASGVWPRAYSLGGSRVNEHRDSATWSGGGARKTHEFARVSGAIPECFDRAFSAPKRRGRRGAARPARTARPASCGGTPRACGPA